MVAAERLTEAAMAVGEAAGAEPVPISAPLGEGVERVLDRIVEHLGTARAPQQDEAEAGKPWSPL